jgi:hypothetical protein
VNNQPIERLWRDVHEKVLDKFSTIFKDLEREEVDGQSCLNIDNPKHIYALHHVFVPLIKKDLDDFMTTHNTRKMDSRGGKSPTYLFMNWFCENRDSNRTAINNYQQQNVVNELVVDIITQREWETIDENIQIAFPRQSAALRLTAVHRAELLSNSRFNITAGGYHANNRDGVKLVTDIFKEIVHFFN